MRMEILVKNFVSALGILVSFLLKIFKTFLIPFRKYIRRIHRIRAQKSLANNIFESADFFEFQTRAEKYDSLPETMRWRAKEKSKYYDSVYISHLLSEIREYQSSNDLDALMKLIRSHSFRNISGILKEELYEDCFFSTKLLIEQFLAEICSSLEFIANSFSLPQETKIEFFSELRHAFGRTALMLSGGGSFGLYHAATIKVFCEAEVMPKIICGSSSGALVAAIICSKPVSQWKSFYFGHGIDFSAFERHKSPGILFNLKRLVKQGNYFDINAFSDWLKDNIGDLTFQEAFDNTSMILNITVSGHGQHNENQILNYLTSPNVLVWSAAVASCGIPYVFGAQDLLCKDEHGNVGKWMPHGKRKFIDGSIDSDIPLSKIAELFNVNCFIVSQVNPW